MRILLTYTIFTFTKLITDSLYLIILYHVAKLRAKKIPCYNYMQHPRRRWRAKKDVSSVAYAL